MNTTHDIETVAEILRAHGWEMTSAQRNRLARYAELLREWNGRINLISRKDEEQLWRNHILHSLAVLIVLPFPREGRVVDIGSGGGLPGIPLAIMLPGVQFVLTDSIGKKIRALGQMAAELEIGNVSIFNGRVEDAAMLETHGRRADCVTARAVTRLDALVRWAAPLLRSDGDRLLIAWKGGELTEEITEARRHPLVQEISEHVIAIPEEPWFTAEEKKLVEARF